MAKSAGNVVTIHDADGRRASIRSRSATSASTAGTAGRSTSRTTRSPRRGTTLRRLRERRRDARRRRRAARDGRRAPRRRSPTTARSATTTGSSTRSTTTSTSRPPSPCCTRLIVRRRRRARAPLDARRVVGRRARPPPHRRPTISTRPSRRSLARTRRGARRASDFARADEIRDQLRGERHRPARLGERDALGQEALRSSVRLRARTRAHRSMRSMCSGSVDLPSLEVADVEHVHDLHAVRRDLRERQVAAGIRRASS